MRKEQAMVSEFQDMALGMQAQVDEFVEQYAECTKRVIDREYFDVKKHGRDLVENAEALAWHEESVVTELRWELLQAQVADLFIELCGVTVLRVHLSPFCGWYARGF